MHGSDRYGAGPNLISQKVSNKLNFQAKPTRKTIIVASGDRLKWIGVIRSIPVFFDWLTTKMEFLVVDRDTVDILIASTDIERLQATIDSGGQFADFTIDGQSVCVYLQRETDHLDTEEEEEEREDEEFTIESGLSDESGSDSVQDPQEHETVRFGVDLKRSNGNRKQ